MSDKPRYSPEYLEYLRSPEWRKKRLDALRRSGHKCDRCESTELLSVHHKTYKNLFHESPSDLTVLCLGCHRTADYERKHGKLKLIGTKYPIFKGVIVCPACKMEGKPFIHNGKGNRVRYACMFCTNRINPYAVPNPKSRPRKRVGKAFNLNAYPFNVARKPSEVRPEGRKQVG